MDRFEITLADVGNIVRNLRAFPSGGPAPVVVFDPITGTYVIRWVYPEPQPRWGADQGGVDFTTIPDEAVDGLRESIGSLKAAGKPADLLLVSTDLLGYAYEFAAVGRRALANVLETEARALTDLALARMS